MGVIPRIHRSTALPFNCPSGFHAVVGHENVPCRCDLSPPSPMRRPGPENAVPPRAGNAPSGFAKHSSSLRPRGQEAGVLAGLGMGYGDSPAGPLDRQHDLGVAGSLLPRGDFRAVVRGHPGCRRDCACGRGRILHKRNAICIHADRVSFWCPWPELNRRPTL